MCSLCSKDALKLQLADAKHTEWKYLPRDEGFQFPSVNVGSFFVHSAKRIVRFLTDHVHGLLAGVHKWSQKLYNKDHLDDWAFLKRMENTGTSAIAFFKEVPTRGMTGREVIKV